MSETVGADGDGAATPGAVNVIVSVPPFGAISSPATASVVKGPTSSVSTAVKRAGVVPELVSVIARGRGALPPHGAAPKSTVLLLGQPARLPLAVLPLKPISVRLEPHVALAMLIDEVALSALWTWGALGVKRAVAVHVSVGLSARKPPSVSAESVMLGSDGGATEKTAGAFPTLVNCTVTGGAVTPTSVETKAYWAEPTSVAPVGIADRSSRILARAGSFVNSDSEPVIAAPAVAAEGTVAVSVRVPDAPAASVREVGVTEKAVPTSVADKASSEPPRFVTLSVCVAAAPPQPTEPKSTAVAPRNATGNASGTLPVAASVLLPAASPTVAPSLTIVASPAA